MSDFRVGFGYDIHRLIDGDHLLLATVSIPHDKKIDAHSDGDIVLHSLSQAILSSLGKEDIGTYFPDNLEETKNLSSTKILSFSLNLLKEEGYRINNVVIDIILERPKLKDYKKQIKDKLSLFLNIPSSSIAVNANTHEKVDSLGKNEAVVVYTNLSIIKD